MKFQNIITKILVTYLSRRFIANKHIRDIFSFPKIMKVIVD